MSDGCHVVTGASSGIGAAVAKRLLARGERVVAVARRADVLQSLYGAEANARVVVADLADPSAVETVAQAAKDAFGPVRGFVHCAGFAAPAPLSLVDGAVARRLYAVHALFPMQFLGWMGKMPNHVAGASCVLVTSLDCHVGAKGNAAYAAAKGAVEGMLKGVAAELADRGVRVNAVAPGVVETEMAKFAWMDRVSSEELAARRADYPFGFGRPDQVADVVDFFLSSASSWVTGQCLVADGGRSLK